MVHCSKCGTQILGDEKVCINCGASLGIIEDTEGLQLLEEKVSERKRSLSDQIMNQLVKIFTRPVYSIEQFTRELSMENTLILFALFSAVSGLLLMMFSKGIYIKVENILTSIPLLSNMDSVILEHSVTRLLLEGTLLAALFSSTLTVILFIIGRCLFNSKTNFLLIFKAVTLCLVLASGGIFVSLMIAYLEVQLGIICFIASLSVCAAVLFSTLRSNMDVSEDEVLGIYLISNIMNLIFVYIVITICLK